jgi:hypothetical protein
MAQPVCTLRLACTRSRIRRHEAAVRYTPTVTTLLPTLTATGTYFVTATLSWKKVARADVYEVCVYNVTSRGGSCIGVDPAQTRFTTSEDFVGEIPAGTVLEYSVAACYTDPSKPSLAYLYAGLFAAVLVVWSLPSLLTRYPRVDGAARHTAITNTRTGLVATVPGWSVGRVGGCRRRGLRRSCRSRVAPRLWCTCR